MDNPYDFGRIAAANALSDIYAMGGVPKTAMNLVAFPVKKMDISILRKIIKGGLEKMQEAGVVLVGGHSVEDQELKYGLAVTGFIHPDRVLLKKNLLPGDRLVLTKPLGTGIINTAIKGGLASSEAIETVTRLMTMLNMEAAEVMGHYPVHACTDITGFGFLGHLSEMVEGSGTGVRLYSRKIPLIPDARSYAGMGLLPAGAYKNREFFANRVIFSPSVDSLLQDILFDPQTSGGLLISVERDQSRPLVRELTERGMTGSAVVGEVMADSAEKIFVE